MTDGWETWFTFLVFNCLTAESWGLDYQEETFLEEHFRNHMREWELQRGFGTQHCTEFLRQLCPKRRTELRLSDFSPLSNRAIILKGSFGSVSTLIFETEGSGGIVKSLTQHLSILDQWFSNSSAYQNHLEFIKQIVGPQISQFRIQGQGWSWKPVFLTSLHAARATGPRPHFENHHWNRHCVNFWEPRTWVPWAGSLASR